MVAKNQNSTLFYQSREIKIFIIKNKSTYTQLLAFRYIINAHLNTRVFYSGIL